MNFIFFAESTRHKKIFGHKYTQQVRLMVHYSACSSIWTKQVIALFACCLVILMSACDKEKKESKLPLKYQNYVLGGCYAESAKSMKADTQDTVIFSIVNDTLILHYGMHYNCCGSLSNSVTVDDNRITIKIIDQSVSMCRCLCYYTADMKFTSFQTGTYSYKVLIKNNSSSDFQVFKEGSVYVIKQ